MKGQSSVEFVAIIGVALVLAAPFVVEGQESMIELATSSEDAQFQASLDELGTTAQQVSASGPRTTRTMQLRIPSNIEDVYVQDQAIIYEMDRGGDRKNFSQSFSKQINANESDLMKEEGLYSLQIESYSGNISISYLNSNSDSDSNPDTNSISKVFNVASQSQWNQGYYNTTSADINSNSGNLGLGYLNGTNPRSSDLEEGLVGYWRMDDSTISGSGGAVKDYSGQGNNGTARNSLGTNSVGVVGTNSFDWGGVDDHVDLGKGITQGFENLSLSFWVKGSIDSGRDSSYQNVIERETWNNENSDGFGVYIKDGYVQGFKFDSPATAVSATDVTDSNWNHVVLSRRDIGGGAYNTTIYVNGDYDASGTTSATISSGSESTSIGARPGSLDFESDLKYDEIRIYNRSLSNNEAKYLYFQGSPFTGNYTSQTIDEPDAQNWQDIEVDASVPSDTSLTVTFQTLSNSVISSLEKKLGSVQAWNKGDYNKSTSDKIKEPYSVSETSISSQQEFNSGSFNGASADRNDNSGDLGLGYRNGSIGDNLVGYWRMDRSVSGSGGTVRDYSGTGNNGAASGGVITGANGIFSTKSFEYDGSNDYVALNNSVFQSGPSTFSVWIKTTSHSTDRGDVFGLISSYFPQSYGYGIFVNESHAKAVASNGGSMKVSGSKKVNDGEWHHIVMTVDGWGSGTTMKLYADGELEAQKTGETGKYTNLPDNSGRIGSAARTYRPFNGNIDEARFYNRSLSSSEIKGLYLNGRPFKGNYTAEKIHNNKLTDWNVLEVNSSGVYGDDVNLSAEFEALDSSGNVIDSEQIDMVSGLNNYSLSVSNSEDARVKFNGASSNVTKSWEVHGFEVFSEEADVLSGGLRIGYRNGSTEDNLVGYWRMDRESGNVVDYSGENNDGATQNFDGNERGVNGIFGTQAFEFDGNNEAIDVPSSSSLNVEGDIAFGGWIKPTVPFSGYEGVIAKGSSNRQYWLWGVDGSSRLAAEIYDTNLNTGGNNGWDLENGKWYHVIVTGEEGGTGRIYVNGQEYSSESIGNGITTSGSVKIGELPGYANWEGSIDDAKVYNRSLSQSEVKDLYFGGRPFQGNYTYKEVEKDWVADWEKVGLNASVPSDTNLSVRFRPLDDEGNVLDEQVVDVSDGSGNYSLDVEDSRRAEVLVNGTSSNVSKTWNLYSLEVYSSRPEVDQSESFEVQDGLTNYSISLSDSEDARVKFNGSSNNVTKSWSVSDFSVFSKE